MIHITRRETFNAAHRLYRPEWDDIKNMQIFGKCSNPNWHGHNYALYVTVKGEPDPETGFVINLRLLGDLVKSRIIDKIDHKNMNLEVDFMAGCIPSTENLAIRIWNQLDEPLRELGAELHCVKVVETEKNYAEYFGNTNN